MSDNDDPWFKVATLINRALLLTGKHEEGAVLRYILEQAKQEAETLRKRIDIKPIKYH